MGFWALHGLLEPSRPFGAFMAFWGLHGLSCLHGFLVFLAFLGLYGLHCLLGLPLICVIVYIRPNLYIPPFGLFDLFGLVLYHFSIITSGFLHKLIPNS